MNLNNNLAKVIVVIAFLVISYLLLQFLTFLNSSKLKYGKKKLSVNVILMIFWMYFEVVKFCTNSVAIYEFYLINTFCIVMLVCVFLATSLYEFNIRKKMSVGALILALTPAYILMFLSLVPEYNHLILEYKGDMYNPFLPSSYEYKYTFFVFEFFIYLTSFVVAYNYNKVENNAKELFQKNYRAIVLLVTIGLFINVTVLRFDIGVTTVIVPFIYVIAFLLMYLTDSYFMNSIVKNLLITEILDSSNSLIIAFDKKNKLVFANDYFVRNCTVSILEDLIGIDINDKEEFLEYMNPELYNEIFHDDNKEFYSIKDKIYKKSIKVVSNSKGYDNITVIEFIDVTYEIEYSHRLTDLTNMDPLTKIKNRFAFQNDFALIDSNMVKDLTCISIDLDNLKITNDVFGHNFGDEIIFKLGSYLVEIFDKEYIYRVGGDEFLVLYLGDVNNVNSLIENLFEKVENYNKDAGLRISFSVGCASYCDLLTNKDDILKFSDITMYESKANGKFAVTYFSDDIYKRQLSKDKMQDDFVRGINEKELVIFIQPKINLKTKKIDSGEALVRWKHKDLGLIAPASFLEIASTLKLISEIDFTVLEKSCILIKELKDNHNIDFHISVNLSLETLVKPSIVYDIVAIVEKYEINPNQITFEILEDKMIQNFNMHQVVISKLKEIGFLFAIDDFGSNFSNFDTIKNLRVDEIKIDKSLTDKVTIEERYAVDVNLIAKMLKQFECTITIEGVETKEQVEILEKFDIDYIQGYYFSRPLPVDELISFVTK